MEAGSGLTPCGAKPQAISLNAEQARAARILHRVYAAADQAGYGRSLEWVDPGSRSDQRPSILSKAYTAPGFWPAGTLASRQRDYEEATKSLVPLIHKASLQWAGAALGRQDSMLGGLAFRVDSRREQLHDAAAKAKKDAKQAFSKEMSREEYMAVTGQSGTKSGPTMPVRLERASYVKAVRQGKDADLIKLIAHPVGVRIVDTFARSAHEGSEYAGELIAASQEAIRFTCTDLMQDEKLIWRFPPAVAAGVATLGLTKEPGVTGFSLNWGTLAGRTMLDKALDIAGNVIFALELVGGPLGGAVAEVLDFVLSLLGVLSAWMLEVEQDQAGTASAFADEAEKFSRSASYSGVVLQGVAAIAASVALPAAVSQVSRSAGRAGAKIVLHVDLPPVRVDPPDPRGLGKRGVDTPTAKGLGQEARGLSDRPAAIAGDAPPATLTAIEVKAPPQTLAKPTTTGFTVNPGAYKTVTLDDKRVVQILESRNANTRPGGYIAGRAEPTAEYQRSVTGALGEDHSYKQKLIDGEVGLQRPEKAAARGIDHITAAHEGGKWRIYVNDSKTSELGKFPTPEGWSESWRNEVRDAVARVDVGDAAVDLEIKKAFTDGEIYLRQLNVDRTQTGGMRVMNAQAPVKVPNPTLAKP